MWVQIFGSKFQTVRKMILEGRYCQTGHGFLGTLAEPGLSMLELARVPCTSPAIVGHLMVQGLDEGFGLEPVICLASTLPQRP